MPLLPAGAMPPAGVVYSMQRCSGGTNQRMYFDVEPCGRHLATGQQAAGGEEGQSALSPTRALLQTGSCVCAWDPACFPAAVKRLQRLLSWAPLTLLPAAYARLHCRRGGRAGACV